MGGWLNADFITPTDLWFELEAAVPFSSLEYSGWRFSLGRESAGLAAFNRV